MPARGVSQVTLQQFFVGVLRQLGAPVNQNNLDKLGAIAAYEGHGGDYNPFNYVSKAAGSTNFNSAGVQNYPDIQTGINMTARLISNHAAFKTNLTSNGDFGGWLGAWQNFYHSWGGSGPNVGWQGGRNKLQATLDGPPVPAATRQALVNGWPISPTADPGAQFSAGTANAFAANPGSYSGPGGSYVAGAPAPAAYSANPADPNNWGGIKTWMDNNEAVFNAWLKTQPADKQQAIIQGIQANPDLAGIANLEQTYGQGVTDYYNYLAQLPHDTAVASVGRIGAAPAQGATAAPPDPGASQQLTDLLSKFDVKYPNAPQPTPALLAFLTGLGLSTSTAEDVKNRAVQRIQNATSDANADIDRTAGRTKQNVTADLVRRGVLQSGEATTRYSRQAEDVATQKSSVERTAAESTASASDAYEQARASARQQALDRVIGAEQDQTTQAALAKQQAEGLQQQSAAADLAWQREQLARNQSTQQITNAYTQAGSQGFAV